MEKNTEIEVSKAACGKCGTVLQMYLRASAYSVVCSSCGAIHNCYNGEPELTNHIVGKAADSHISVGIRGTLKGIPYLVTGYVYKKENGTNYCWEEYVLFNPVHGQAYLSQFDGHWMCLCEMADIPSATGLVATHDGSTYNLYSKYKSKILSARGEFVYKIDPSETPIVEEYIRPGYLVSKERTKDYATWYKGEYIQPSVIKSSFQLASVPETKGVGMIQPFLGKFSQEGLRKVFIFLFIFWSLLQFYFTFASREEIVFEQPFSITDSLHGKEINSRSFELKGGTCNAEIQVHTNVQNNWMCTAVTLVNEKTGDIFDVGLEAEYYYGYTDGESWSEGTGWVSKVVSQVPEGTYYMVITPEKPTSVPVVNITVTVIRDVFIMSNGLIVLALLSIYPIYYHFKKNKFEKQRWYNSDYSPYENNDEDNY